DISELKYEATVTKPGPPIDLQISGNDLKNMQYAADSLKKKLAEYSGVYGISDTLSQGKQQIQLHLKPLARDLGMSLDELALQVRAAFYGQEIQTIQRGEDEVKVIVRYPTKERNELWSLENMNVFLRSDYTSVPLSTVADIEFAESPSEIVREDGKRVVRVSAYVDENFTTPTKVLEDLKKDFLPRLMNNLPGLSWAPSGQQQMKDDLIQHILVSSTVALLAMYILLAIVFKSYTQPVMVMSAIPFGLVGAVLGHMMMGYEVTIWSIVGIIAVSGIVVNTNVVLVDFVNHAREAGMPLIIAIRESGIRRFRAVVLSSICNFVGISSMMYESSFQGKFLVPMAISIGWGVLFSAFICIFLIPALYHVNEDIKEGVKNLLSYLSSRASRVHAGGQVVAESAHAGWDNDMNTAYERGYQDGLSGRVGRKSPYDIEVLAASWEAGWDDGRAEFEASK
ncbi:MAG TPA: efflux RND transporter permease subunit, partial [Pseudomonadales bacterium]|nr:efflux RND transporter permease subunit [Pseudomonadales bacterium]